MSEYELQPISDPSIEGREQKSVEQSRESLRTVFVHNDDVTPYEYVISMLNAVFMLSEELADHIALTAHETGSAVVVVRPCSEAQKLVSVANGRAKADDYPLTFTLESE